MNKTIKSTIAITTLVIVTVTAIILAAWQFLLPTDKDDNPIPASSQQTVTINQVTKLLTPIVEKYNNRTDPRPGILDQLDKEARQSLLHRHYDYLPPITSNWFTGKVEQVKITSVHPGSSIILKRENLPTWTVNGEYQLNVTWYAIPQDGSEPELEQLTKAHKTEKEAFVSTVTRYHEQLIVVDLFDSKPDTGDRGVYNNLPKRVTNDGTLI